MNKTFLKFRLFIILFAAIPLVLSAQNPPQVPPQGGQARRMDLPRKGPCPLPILPALPAYSDSGFYAMKAVPHGRIEKVNYLAPDGKEKRMHVYLPPDYDPNSTVRYPVLYLNHGGGDDDSGWTLENNRQGGYAHLILDNLIAGGKAKPMIIVMPNTRGIASANPPVPGTDDQCSQEYISSIIPFIDSHYRTKASREYRALAGLSMGGFVVLHTGLPHLDTFSELYIYSSGHISPETQTQFEENFKAVFSDSGFNGLFRVPLYMAAGETDIALYNGMKDLAVFNRYGVRNFWVLSDGGHEWANWRRYLYQTAQVMFPDCDNKQE
ncbi:MAG: alpha/beta hydrolase-fold protein [Bacteroidales bacterium]|jgi:enterochelin esterase-like enzyme|nr:alpha/beta hydrolase-fold protein [Bacteroidales bacterium]